MDYSHGEYPIVKKFFEEHTPRYKMLVDVGANVAACNSYNLIFEDDWQAILIEPTPATMERLKETYKGRQGVEFLQFAVDDYVGEAKFYIHPSSNALNTLKQNCHYDALDEESKKQIKEVTVQVRPLAYILEDRRIPYDFDFLKIDSEGFDYKILNDFLSNSYYRPTYIIHEIQGPGPEFFVELLKKFGYTRTQTINGNQHFVRTSNG